MFKDELRKMLPHDDDAGRLAGNVYHFGEFFTAFGIAPPLLEGRAILWGHCHQRATGGIEPEEQVLQDMGLAVRNLKGGCCGLAGSWGFESGKYGISMDCGEQALLPAVRDADPATLIVADGFSCKTQIADSGAGRHALHTAEVMPRSPRWRTGRFRDRGGRWPGGEPSPAAAEAPSPQGDGGRCSRGGRSRRGRSHHRPTLALTRRVQTEVAPTAPH